jgi:hypothetical protein
MTKPIEVIERNGKRAEILYDEFAENPRQMYDNLGTMVCKHMRYDLGDHKIKLDSNDFESWDEIEEYLKSEYNAEIILPLYLYDHSGIAMNTTGFSCGWDSGQVGFIFIDHKTCVKEFGEDYSREKIVNLLKGEVEEYDAYLRGEMYGYRILEKARCPHCNEVLDNYDDEELEASYGYVGLESVREAVKYELDR